MPDSIESIVARIDERTMGMDKNLSTILDRLKWVESVASDVKEYPEITSAGHINSLMKSDFEFVLAQSFVCMEKRSAKAFLKQQAKFLKDAKDMAQSQIDELTDAMDDLESGRFVMGHHYLSLQVFGDDIKLFTFFNRF